MKDLEGHNFLMERDTPNSLLHAQLDLKQCIVVKFHQIPTSGV